MGYRSLCWTAPVAVAALLFVAPVSAAPVSNSVSSTTAGQPSYQDGAKALASGNLDLAQKSFEAVLAAEPKRVQAVLGLAEIARLRGNAGDTEKYLRRAAELAPGDVVVADSWSKWLNSQRRFDEAREALEKTLSTTPAAPQLWTNLGVLYAGPLNNKAKATEALRTALKYDNTLPGTHFALGALLAESGDLGAGEKELMEAARLSPKDPRPYEMLGAAQSRADAVDKAVASYEKALAIDPGYVSARIGMGDAQLKAKRVDLAEKAFTAATETNPLADGAWLRLGMLEAGRGRLAVAERAYRKAIEANPNQAFALNNLAVILAEQPMTTAEALKFAERAVAISPNPLFLDTLALVYRARKEFPQAAETLKAAVAKAPNDAPLNYRLGVVLEDLKDKPGATAAYQKALSLDPSLADAKTRLAALQK